MLAINWHTHCKITGCPRTLGVQIDHSPHVVVDVVHFDCVGDFFLVEFGPAREYVNILVVENARCC